MRSTATDHFEQQGRLNRYGRNPSSHGVMVARVLETVSVERVTGGTSQSLLLS